jgi:hypothetical protein
LIRGQETGDQHRAVELLHDDLEVPPVLALSLKDLSDDLLPLGATFGAVGANRAGNAVLTVER